MMPLAPFIILCLVSIVGTLGNVFIIAAVSLRKKLRVRANIFIVNLAVADLIITGYIMPIGLMTSQYEVSVNPFGNQTLCEFNAFLILTTLGVSTQSLMLIGLERYVHICRGVNWYARLFKPWLCGLFVFICWVYTILWTCQGWTGWTKYVYGSKLYICLFDANEDISYTICLALFGVVLPIVVVVFSYVNIFKTVRKSRHNLTTAIMTNKNNNNINDPVLKEYYRKKRKKLHREYRLIVTLFTIVIIFIIFWLPAAITLTLTGGGIDTPDILFQISIWTAFANSSVNSIVYGALNKNFRDGYKTLFRYVFCCGRTECKPLNVSQSNQSNEDDDTLTTSQQQARLSAASSTMTELSGVSQTETELKRTKRTEYGPSDNYGVSLTETELQRTRRTSPDDSDNYGVRLNGSKQPEVDNGNYNVADEENRNRHNENFGFESGGYNNQDVYGVNLSTNITNSTNSLMMISKV